MRGVEGLFPEIGVVTVSVFFVIIMALMRSTYKGDAPKHVINMNANHTGWFISFMLSITYGILIWRSPFEYKTSFGLHSDSVIYSFRLAIVMIFVLYFAYLYRDLWYARVPYSFEYYFVLLYAMIGLSLMTTASSFFNLLLFMELYSLCTYYLIQGKSKSLFSTEAAFKYFLTSSFSTAIYLFGVFLVYYGSGNLDFVDAEILSLQIGL